MQNNTQPQAGGCRRVRLATMVWAASRVVSAGVTLALMAAGLLAGTAVSTVLGVLVVLGIGYMLRRGVRVLAWLGLAGGLGSLALNLMGAGSVLLMAQKYPVLAVYLAVCVADGLVQTAVNAVVLADPAYKAYAEQVRQENEGK